MGTRIPWQIKAKMPKQWPLQEHRAYASACPTWRPLFASCLALGRKAKPIRHDLRLFATLLKGDLAAFAGTDLQERSAS